MGILINPPTEEEWEKINEQYKTLHPNHWLDENGPWPFFVFSQLRGQAKEEGPRGLFIKRYRDVFARALGFFDFDSYLFACMSEMGKDVIRQRIANLAKRRAL